MAPLAADRYEELQRRYLARREARRAENRPARVVGRSSDGAALLQRLDGECVARGGVGGYQGEVVTHLAPLVNRRGTSGVAQGRVVGQFRGLHVESLTPTALERGVAGQSIAVAGQGFEPSFRLEFLLPDSEEVHPGITVVSITVASATAATVVVDVAADATLLEDGSAPIAYDNVGAPL